MDKQVHDLSSDDFVEHPIWVFPMDETLEDELTVRPFSDTETDVDLQALVRADFADSKGQVYPGYLYWGAPERIEYLKPVMWLADLCVTFWNGMQCPDATYMNEIRERFGPEKTPISYQTYRAEGFEVIRGEVAGLYYLADIGIGCEKL